MFSFKFKRLSLCLRKLWAAARLGYSRRSLGDGDPRDIQQIEDQLRHARELARLQVTRGRLLW